MSDDSMSKGNLGDDNEASFKVKNKDSFLEFQKKI